MSTQYWFRPKKFWKFFAFYYPTSLSGWLATAILFMIGLSSFQLSQIDSNSPLETLLRFAPWLIAIFALYDLLCFRFGEYPSWWRKKKKWFWFR